MVVRYEFGGDEFIFVEISEAMSLEVNFQAMAITKRLKGEAINGSLDICPGNASYTVRFNPELINPEELVSKLKDLSNTVNFEDIEITSRIVDVPILFEDPWTHKTLMQFRERHQDPKSTDLEYTARINGFHSTDELIQAITGSPYLVSMVGFVPGLPWCYQIVPHEKQIQVPKYVRPRTYTPERAFGYGGAFSVVYPVQGAGGYQLFGTAAAPIFENDQRNYDFKDTMTFPKQGDIFKYRSITMDEYESIRNQVKQGTFRYHMKSISYTLQKVLEDPTAFSNDVVRRLYE